MAFVYRVSIAVGDRHACPVVKNEEKQDSYKITWFDRESSTEESFFSSAKDVDPVLSFEKEEDAVVKATEKLAVDIEVEDSGSLKGLGDKLSWCMVSSMRFHLKKR